MKPSLTIFAILIATFQTQAQSSIKFGANVSYHAPNSNQKESTSPFLFLNLAQSAGLELSFAPNKKSSTRIKFAADYITGTNNKESVAAYAKEKDIIYTSYKFTQAINLHKLNQAVLALWRARSLCYFQNQKIKNCL